VKSRKPTLKMLLLLEKMVREPLGWGRVFYSLKDGRKQQGLVRTLWALERRGWVRLVEKGDTFTLDGMQYTAEGAGWMATQRGHNVIHEYDRASKEIARRCAVCHMTGQHKLSCPERADGGQVRLSMKMKG
jgi:hypothetical protein